MSAVALAAGLCSAAVAQRDGPGDDPKAYLIVSTDALRLKWNADQGENGRGRGEIYYTAWAYWPVMVCEGKNPDGVTDGPVGGSTEFPSGAIVDDPDHPGQKTIVPAEVELNKRVLHCLADCPVADYIELDILVWDEDSNKELNDYTKKLADAVDEAEADATYGGIPGVIARALEVLIDVLTKDADDPLGKFRGQVEFPNPCLERFEVIRTVDLTNMAAPLWREVNAESEDGSSFKDASIDPPDVIGQMDLKISGGPVINKFSSHVTTGDPPGTGDDPGRADASDVAQPDEATLRAGATLKGQIPKDGTAQSLRYCFMLDTDNDAATGAPLFPAQGAEFQLRVEFDAQAAPHGTVLRYDAGAGLFVPTGPAKDVLINAARFELSCGVLLDDIGNPDGGRVAQWIVIERDGVRTDVFPPDPAAYAPSIPIDRCYTGLPPFVVSTSPSPGQIDVTDWSGGIRIRFSKSMDLPTTQAAFQVIPPVPGAIHWEGNEMVFTPAVAPPPLTTLQVLLQGALARDTAGTPLDNDLDGEPDPLFAFSFTTDEPRLNTSGSDGVATGFFYLGEQIWITGTELPARRTMDAYQVSPFSRLAPGDTLEDLSSNGPDAVTTTNQGTLLASLGVMHNDGEFNVVLDTDRDGAFTPGVDFTDRTGIGFFYQLVDCNVNGMDDSIDILSGHSDDQDGNGIPDECDNPCPADLDEDGDADGDDFFAYLDLFAAGDPGADLDGDGDRDADDFFMYLDLFAQGC